MPHTHSKQSFTISQALSLANVFGSGAHHLPSAKDDSQNFQITSDLYRDSRATESPIPDFVPGLTSQLRARYN